MKKIMAFGTFDVLHKGHRHYLKESKKYGDYLIVVVARDQNIEKFKGKPPLHSEQKRLKEIAGLDFVDEAVLGSLTDIFSVIKEKNPDILCLGYDQNPHDLEAELKKRNLTPKIIRIGAYKPEIYKSSIIKAILENKNKAYGRN